MPSRIVREEILTSERIDRLDWAQEVFYRRLLSKVDDHGLYDARPSLLRSTLYPLRVDKVREADCSRWLAACEMAGLIVLYEAGGKPYLKVLDTRWQARSEPKYPLPPEMVNGCEQLKTVVPVVVDVVEDVVESVSVVESVARAPRSPKAGTSGQGSRLDPLWVLPPEWAKYAMGERPDWTTADVERVALAFRDHWHGKAGKDARRADWLATWRTWVRNERRFYRSEAKQPPVDRRTRGMDVLAGRLKSECTVESTAKRVDRPPVLPDAGALRLESGDLVGER